MPYLVIEGPNGQLIQVPLGPEMLTLGRDPGCEITLDDRLVSRQHVSISPGFIVQDLDSFNGVYVRGKRIQRAFLVAGEGFRIGATGKFEVRITQDEQPTVEEAQDEGLQTLADVSMAGGAMRRSPGRDSKPSISPDVEERLDSLRRETERLGRENDELRQMLDGSTDSSAESDTVEPTPLDPGSSPEATAASSETMIFHRKRGGNNDPPPREES